MAVFLNEVVLDLPKESYRLLGDLHQDVTPVAICMHKVVLHQHLEEGRGSQSGDDLIEFMLAVKVSDRHSFHKTFNEDGVPGLLLKGLRELDGLVATEMVVESNQVVTLDVEVDLVNQSLLQRTLSHWDLVGFREDRQDLADAEHDIDISLDVLVHIWVPYLHSHFLPSVDCLVDLAD